jgi:hypothetical protein
MTHKPSSESPEVKVLQKWHITLAVIVGIAAPCITATGAYWGLKLQIEEKHRAVSDRISKVELDTEKDFANKTTLDDLSTEVKHMHDDVLEIKTFLKSQRRR